MILRTCVVVPTFDNSRAISSVIKDIVTKTSFPVLIIDDGSETPVVNSLYSFEVKQAQEQGRVRVIRFEQNRGKGAALQVAIQDLVQQGFTHMLTMDGDGQHFARDIEKLTNVARTHPWDLIIGNRRMEGDNVPGVSKFGRKFSNFWVKYQTGSQIKDSQSGFRLYPLFPIQTMKFVTTKYDFEIEVLIRLLWKGIVVREVEIDVLYPKPEERITHFDKLWDNVRISLLNTALVAVSLVRSRKDPKELAVSAAIGVIIGCTPFFGVHTFLVIAAAFAFRLNVIAMLVGSQISLLPFVPFLIAGSIFFGEKILPGWGEVYQYFVGSFVLGPLLGSMVALSMYGTSYYYRRAKPTGTNWSGRTRGGRLGNGFLKLVIDRVGLRAGYFCLFFIVPYFWIFAPKARKGLNEYYRLISPGGGWFARQGKVLKHFFRFGQVLMDRLYQGFRGGQQFPTRADGMDQILTAMSSGRGLIVLSAHLGGWDLAAALLGSHGFSDQIHVVEYQADGLNFQKVKDKMDPSYVRSVDTNRGKDAIFEIHQALKQGRCLGLMGDRPIGDRFELIPFLGKLAPFDVTAFRMAAATRVPLLFTFGFKGKDGHYDFFARPPREYIFDESLPRAGQLYAWAEEYVREIERLVLKYPDQWFNFYPFWSALPVAPNGALAAQSNNNLATELNTQTPPVPEWESDPKPNVSTKSPSFPIRSV